MRPGAALDIKNSGTGSLTATCTVGISDYNPTNGVEVPIVTAAAGTGTGSLAAGADHHLHGR
jgi:hypothetical protein